MISSYDHLIYWQNIPVFNRSLGLFKKVLITGTQKEYEGKLAQKLDIILPFIDFFKNRQKLRVFCCYLFFYSADLQIRNFNFQIFFL